MGFKLIPWRKRSRAIEMDEINVWLFNFNMSDDKMCFFGSNFMLFSKKNVFLKNNQQK